MIKESKYLEIPKHAHKLPYLEFEKTSLWRTVKKAVSELEKNQDLNLTTDHHYVVGYICKQIVHGNLTSKKSIERTKSIKSTK